MGIIKSGDNKIKLMSGDVKVKRAYAGDVKIYSAGNIITYYVDSSTVYREEVDEGASCLSPKTFAPTKDGWEFAGWRQDTAANGSVLSSLAMGDAPVTLYAVFRQTITLSYNGNSATSGSTAAQTGIRYYNNGNVANPSFTLRSNGFARTNATFYKWALGSLGGIQYAAGTSVTLSASTSVYAKWSITASVPVNLNRPQQRGVWTGTANITNSAVTSASISGTLKSLNTSKDDGRCNVYLYVNDSAINSSYYFDGSLSISKTYGAISGGITVKLYVEPHAQDLGGGSFIGTVKYTTIV